MGRRRVSVTLVIAVVLGSIIGPSMTEASVAPPSNDNFSAAKAITSLPYTDAGVNTSLATVEPNEPTPSCVGGDRYKTVWYRYVPSTTTTIDVSIVPTALVGNAIRPFVALYAGSGFDSFIEQGCARTVANNGTVHLAVPVTAGITYYFQAGSNYGYDGPTEAFDFNLQLQVPSNDYFQFAKAITSLPYTDAGVNTSLATVETNEPDPGCEWSWPLNTVWYRYVAGATSSVTARVLPTTLNGNSIDPFVAAYEGTGLSSFIKKGCSYGDHNQPTSLVVPVTAGHTYYFQVGDGYSYNGPIKAFDFTLVGPTTVVTSTYHPITPARLLDTRSGNGHSGRLTAGVPITFQVSGRGGVPSGASAVTGNLTVTDSSAPWAVYLGPSPLTSPATSTINFTAGQTIANGVTVALSSTGTVSATYMGPAGATTSLVFDVTGFYTADSSGQTYHPISPVRDVDTRFATGLPGNLKASTPACFGVAGVNGVPSSAKAVTGNATVANPTSAWALYLGPLSTSTPSTSTLNFTGGQVASNNVTVALDNSGRLCATYLGPAGATTDLVFDVTGYYTADSSGASFVPVSPIRLLDTRSGNGLSGKLTAGAPRTFVISGRGGIPAGATAVTGNLTVTDENAGWAIYVGPAPLQSPPASSLNFVVGDVKANGVSAALSGTGALSATYMGPAGATTDLVFDVTGYFMK